MQNKKYNIKDVLYYFFIILMIIFSFIIGIAMYNSQINIKQIIPNKMLKYVDMAVLDVDINKKIHQKNIKYENEKKNVYEFNVLFEDRDITQNVKLINSCPKFKNVIDNKIAPGFYGSFAIIINNLNNPVDMNYKIKFEDLTNEKPTNMKFYLENDLKMYESLQKLSESINGDIAKQSKKKIKINWKWAYDSNNEIDTIEGKKLKNYKFKISVIGREK